MKRLGLLKSLVLYLLGSYAQSAQHYNHYLLMNPAYAGVKEKHSVGMVYRNLTSPMFLTGYGSSNIFRPCRDKLHSYFMHYDLFSEKAKSGFGVYYGHFRFGEKCVAGNNKSFRDWITKSHTINFSYTFHIKVNEHKIIPGVGFNLNRQLFNANHPLYIGDPFGPVIYAPESINRFMFDLGIWYNFNNINLGFSVKDLVETGPEDDNGPIYQIMVNYKNDLSKSITLNPYGFFSIQKFEDNRRFTTISIGLNSILKGTFFFGINYLARPTSSVKHTISPIIGVSIKEKIQLLISFNIWIDDFYDGIAPLDVESGINAEF